MATALQASLTQTDRETLLSLVDQKPLPADESIRIRENFELFAEQSDRSRRSGTTVQRPRKLMIVDIALSRDHDNPQLIFESMNSTGRELSQADLIRNFILMGLEPKHQSRLYEDHWRPMEVAFGQEAYGQHFDSFMRHYLTVRTEEIPRVKDVYDAFKKYARSPEAEAGGVDGLVTDIQVFAGYYCNMALGREPDPVLALAFADLRELKVEVAYPLLLDLYESFEKGTLSRDDFAQAVRWVESYVFRRAVCAINQLAQQDPRTSARPSTRTGSREHAGAVPALAVVQAVPRRRRVPAGLKQRDLYNFRSRSYWLRRLENAGRKERVPVDEYTIEHIMPQNADLPSEWRSVGR